MTETINAYKDPRGWANKIQTIIGSQDTADAIITQLHEAGIYTSAVSLLLLLLRSLLWSSVVTILIKISSAASTQQRG